MQVTPVAPPSCAALAIVLMSVIFGVNFAKNGIPVIFYFNGVHADYHQETDEVAKIDFTKMEKISRLVFFTAWQLASQTERIKIDSSKK